MSKERKKPNLKDYIEYYSELIELDDEKEIYGRLEESKAQLMNLINYIKSATHFGRSILNLLIESMKPVPIIDTGSDFLNLLHLSAFYSNLLELFISDTEKKISYLKKNKRIKSMIKQQYLLDGIGILRISSLVLTDMSGFQKKFKEFVKKTNFDESFPKYEELIELQHELEKMEKEIKSHSEKVFEFRI